MWYCFIHPQVELMQLAKSEAICYAGTLSQDHPHSMSTGKNSSASSHISEIPGSDDFVLPNHCSPGADLVIQHLFLFLLQLSSTKQSQRKAGGTARIWHSWLCILMALTMATLWCASHILLSKDWYFSQIWSTEKQFSSHQKTNTHLILSTIKKQMCIFESHTRGLYPLAVETNWCSLI